MKLGTILTLTLLSTLVACKSGTSLLPSGSGTPDSGLPDSTSSPVGSFPVTTNNLRISLTDAPSRVLKSVFVNVDHAELFVQKGGARGRIIVSQGLGMVDLMTLRNGVLLPMQDLNLAVGLQITGIRLVLKGENNHAIKGDDSRCEMQTPSGQQSGIKIHLAQPFTLESGSVYSMVMDFDAAKSVVIKGNGGCLLKPVLKLLNVTKIPFDSIPDGGDVVANPEVTPDPVTDGADINVGGGDTSSGSDPASGDTTGGNTGGGGFEIPLDPVDEPPVIDGDSTFTMG